MPRHTDPSRLSVSRFAASFDGARIAYRIYGTGEPTVLLSNGIGCNQAYVDHLIRALAERHRTMIWDYRGHLDSDRPADPKRVTVDCCLADMEAVVAAAGIARPVLAGFSMGVQISLEYYRRHPDAVIGMMALLGPYEYPLRSFYHLGQLWEKIIPALLDLVRARPEQAQKVWSTVLTGPWMFPAARLLELNRKAARRDDFVSWTDHLAGMDLELFLQMALVLNRHSAADVLPGLRVPCLVVAGDADGFTPVATARRMHELAPGSELFVVEGASHGGLFEFPEQINARVLEFMERHF
jgi:pimeloyl-ACP methyl ester carboxylesterase